MDRTGHGLSGTDDPVGSVLSHYGVKGMKWGVRRSGKIESGPSSEDAKSAREAAKVVKKHGTQALSNKELKALVERMNLETQFSQLQQRQSNPGAFSRIDGGTKKVRTIINAGNTVNDAIKFAQSPIGMMVVEKLKS